MRSWSERRDVPLLGHLLAMLAHALAGRAIGHARNVQAEILPAEIAEPVDAIAEAARLSQAANPVRHARRQAYLHAAHALHATAEGKIDIGAQHSGCLEHRHHAGRACEDCAERRGGLIDARFDQDLARNVAPAEVGRDRPPHMRSGRAPAGSCAVMALATGTEIAMASSAWSAHRRGRRESERLRQAKWSSEFPVGWIPGFPE